MFKASGVWKNKARKLLSLAWVGVPAMSVVLLKIIYEDDSLGAHGRTR